MPYLLDRVRRPRAGLRGSFAAISVGLIATFAVWASAAPAGAHEELVSSDPSEAGVVTTWPSRVILAFSGEVSEVHEITVTGPDGSVTNGDPTANGVEVQQAVWTGPDGAYTMTYDVVSADGHEMAGEIQFDVAVGSAETDDPSSTSDPVNAPDASPDPAPDSSDGPGVVVLVIAVLASLAVAATLLLRRRTRRTPSAT